ncbi:MAG: glycosyltransferase family 2 protein [Candidatus Omnitrophica bacterium]|nr:glycosyltransferase family 2 protein [Candidatus Omnitrophota bacterium]
MEIRKPLISVIVCTYNRAALLEKTLNSLIVQKPDFGFEILVIDNNSSDNTSETVENLKSRAVSPISYFLEKKLGIAVARNRGADLAKGQYIAYIDDDAVASPNWLREIINAFSLVKPKPACCVGRVKLDWQGERQKWFPKEHETLLGKYDFGDSKKFLGSQGYLVTMNAAFDRDIFLRLGKFKTYLGRKGNCLLSGEDNNMYDRIYQAKHPIYYNPDQLIYHFVPDQRQTLRWLTKRIFWDGATQVIIDFENKQINSNNCLAKTAYDIKAALSNMFLALAFSFLLNKEKLIIFFLRSVIRAGRVYMALVFFGLKKQNQQ